MRKDVWLDVVATPRRLGLVNGIHNNEQQDNHLWDDWRATFWNSPSRLWRHCEDAAPSVLGTLTCWRILISSSSIFSAKSELKKWWTGGAQKHVLPHLLSQLSLLECKQISYFWNSFMDQSNKFCSCMKFWQESVSYHNKYQFTDWWETCALS